MSSDRPANIRDLPVEQQDTIQDVLAVYIDDYWDDYYNPYEGDERVDPTPMERAQDLYHQLTGAWRVMGGNRYTADPPTIRVADDPES